MSVNQPTSEELLLLLLAHDRDPQIWWNSMQTITRRESICGVNEVMHMTGARRNKIVVTLKCCIHGGCWVYGEARAVIYFMHVGRAVAIIKRIIRRVKQIRGI